MMLDGSEPAFEVGPLRIKVDQEAEGDCFYQTIVPFDSFDDVMRRDRYRPLPDDWIIAVTDVSHSTEAIEQGRYREVNTAGAAVLAAVSNALPDLQFPSTFGGDGASVAAPGAYSSIIKDTLAKTAAWAEDTLGLTLRIAVIPIADIRAQHLDVLVARFAPSSNVTYAMFAGGGLAWAERKLKEGGYTAPRAPLGVTADLTGLSCRFAPISTRHGVILSLIVVSRDDQTSFMELIQELLRTLRSDQPGRLHCLPKARSPHGPPTILSMPSRKAAERCPLRFGLRGSCAPFWRGWALY
jgi:hypothetical protein